MSVPLDPRRAPAGGTPGRHGAARPGASRPASARSRRPLRWGAGAAVLGALLVPPAVAGLVVGSFGDADDGIDRIPAAIVNSDELVYQTAADGTQTPVFAGRQLVTELTGPDNQAFDWTITNASDAEDALEAGDVYAVLTVPDDFSTSILSLQGDDPVQADIGIRTDDAHGYLSGVLAQTVGTGLSEAFGTTVTEQYLTGVYGSVQALGAALGTAADGATALGTGASDLSAGLGSLADGAASAQTGAATLSTGIGAYTSGVDSLATGLGALDDGAAGLDDIGTGVSSYTSGVAQLSAGISQATALLADADPTNDPVAAATLQALSARLAGVADSGAALGQGVTTGIDGVQSGIAQSAAGAARLSAGSSALASGAASLAGGLAPLTSGATDAAAGAGSLASGATELATGLRTGADQVPVTTDEQRAQSAEVAATPVTSTLARENEADGVAPVISTLFLPIALWVGALAIFLVLRPLSAAALASSAGTRRVASAVWRRAGLLAVLQAVLVTVLLYSAFDADWTRLPAALGFAVLASLAFTAFHHLLTAALGRAGLVVSLLLLALQVTATGGPYPVELLTGPFQALSPVLPLSYAVSGLEAILLGGTAGPAVAGVVALLLFGVVSVLLTLVAVRRSRRSATLRMLPLPAPAPA
jgi:putative membrane protein